MPAADQHDSVFEDVRIPALRTPQLAADHQSLIAELALQRDAARTGTDLLVICTAVSFVALIVAYAAFRVCRLEVFLFGRYYLDSDTGLLASLTLLLSVFTAGLAARCGESRRPRQMRRAIVATIALGVTFVAIQGHDFWSKAQHGLLPGARFVPTQEVWATEAFTREHPAAARLARHLDAHWLTITNPPVPVAAHNNAPLSAQKGSDASARALLRKIGVVGPAATLADVPSRPQNAHAFWGFYFLLMGVHAAYLSMGLAGWVSLLVPFRTELAAPTLMRLDGTTVFWKFLAMVWVVLFPLFYLVH